MSEADGPATKNDSLNFFDAERRRLGAKFETELLKWLGDDVEKHYWVSFFVESESYLHGNKSLPQLSLLIKRGLKFALYGKAVRDVSWQLVELRSFLPRACTFSQHKP